MDEIINGIINLDNETNIMKDKYEDIIQGKDEELRLRLIELEKSFSNETKTEISNMLHEILWNSADNFDAGSDDVFTGYMNKLENTYKNIKDRLVEETWRELFLKEE
ncbi:hypothetical protein E9840_04195 [Tissierella creatinini]|nr:hypothetical protein E9840_04195 [Tissierella creatinini]TJX66349.1 hypothetical protein E8P77_08140 [Soehngenia saccharolytica]